MGPGEQRLQKDMGLGLQMACWKFQEFAAVPHHSSLLLSSSWRSLCGQRGTSSCDLGLLELQLQPVACRKAGHCLHATHGQPRQKTKMLQWLLAPPQPTAPGMLQ